MSNPRLLVAGEVARLLNLPSARCFLARLNRLRSAGFPDSVAALGRRWDREAVHRWLDAQAGIGQPFINADDGELIRRARNLGETHASR